MKKFYLENKTKKHKISAFKKIALSTTVALSAFSLHNEANAGQIYINGNAIYYVGNTYRNDDQALAQVYAEAKAAGIAIDTIVFKNSAGGSLYFAERISDFIEKNKLNTVAEGVCLSACSLMFSAGQNRQLAQYDYQFNYNFMGNIIGIHGASINGRPVKPEDNEDMLERYTRYLTPESEAISSGRIEHALNEIVSQNGFLFYHDPKVKENDSVVFCPTQDRTKTGNCITYGGVNIHTDKITTTDKYFTVNDRYILTNDHNGAIENNWSKLEWYSNDTIWIYRGVPDQKYVLPSKSGPLYGTIIVPNGTTWNLDTTQSAHQIFVDRGTINLNANSRFDVADLITAVNGGTINLNGGTLSRPTELYKGSTLSGNGVISKPVWSFGSIVKPEGIVLRSYDFNYFAPQSRYEHLREKKHRFTYIEDPRFIRLIHNSTLSFNISNETTVAPLRIEKAYSIGIFSPHEDYEAYPFFNNPTLKIDKDSTLELNIQSGFYSNGQVIPLVSSIEDKFVPDDFSELCKRGLTNYIYDYTVFCLTKSFKIADLHIEHQQDFITGEFLTAKRSDDDEYSLDLTKEGAIFTPTDDSLISFTISQTKNGIWITANDSFTDISMFGNERSGNRLGEVIKSEYANPTSGIKPLIGALQFSNARAINSQASSLRGDGHSSLRLVHHNVIDQLSGVVQNSILNPTQRVTVDKYLQPTNDNNASQFDQSHKNTFWLSGFGRTGSVDTYKKIFGLDYDNIGTAGGLSRNLSDKLLIGASVGYSKITTNSNSENHFQAESEALSASVYGNISHNRGYVSSNLGFAKISNETLRSVGEINGLEGVIKSDYDVNAIFGHLESGFDFHRGNNKVTLLAPVLRYTNISETKFNDEGSLNHKLGGTLEDYTSFKAGIGLHAESNIVKSNWNLTPFARVVWQHEFMDSDARSLNHFAYAKSQSFHSVSRPLGTETVDWNIGMRSSTFSNRVNLSLEYQGQSLSGASSHGVQAGVQFKF